MRICVCSEAINERNQTLKVTTKKTKNREAEKVRTEPTFYIRKFETLTRIKDVISYKSEIDGASLWRIKIEVDGLLA